MPRTILNGDYITIKHLNRNGGVKEKKKVVAMNALNPGLCHRQVGNRKSVGNENKKKGGRDIANGVTNPFLGFFLFGCLHLFSVFSKKNISLVKALRHCRFSSLTCVSDFQTDFHC